MPAPVKGGLFRQFQRSLLYMGAMFTISVVGYRPQHHPTGDDELPRR